MRRYGRHAGELAGQCVPLGIDTEGGSTSGSSSPGEGGSTLVVDGSGPFPGESTSTGPSDTETDGEPWLEFIDDDERDFAAGDPQGVAWLDGGLQLSGTTDGIFESRVFDAGDVVRWQVLRWTPRAPYGKSLPGDGFSERGYIEGNADMTANILLLRLDGNGEDEAGPGALLEDASGQGHHFTLQTDAGVPWVDGRFGRALADDESSYAYNGSWRGAFSFQDDDFSWSIWARSGSPCVGEVNDNQVYLGVDGVGSERSHLWLGCRHATSSNCDDGSGELGRAGGTYSPNVSGGSAHLCGASELIDEQWHHLAVTKLGHEETQMTLYVDGEVVDVDTEAFLEGIEFPAGAELAIGAFSDGTYPAEVTLDEVAIWRRGLSASEVGALYRRGARRLRVGVRVCDDPECSTAGPFVGPDGADSTRFVDPADALGPAVPLALPEGLEGRYFQYRAQLSGTSELSPVLQAVMIEAQPL